MSRTTDIFVAARATTDVITILERAADRRFIREDGTRPYLMLDQGTVYVACRHQFADDIIALPDGTAVRLRSEYPVWIEVRDREHDQARQEAIGQLMLDALAADGRWKAVFIDDMRHVIDSYDPANECVNSPT